MRNSKIQYCLFFILFLFIMQIWTFGQIAQGKIYQYPTKTYPKIEFSTSVGIIWLSQFMITYFPVNCIYIQPRFSTILLGYDKGISIGYQKRFISENNASSYFRFGIGYSKGDFVIISADPVDITTKWKGIYFSIGTTNYFRKHPHIGWNIQYNMIFRDSNNPLPSINIGFHYGIFNNKRKNN